MTLKGVVNKAYEGSSFNVVSISMLMSEKLLKKGWANKSQLLKINKK